RGREQEAHDLPAQLVEARQRREDRDVLARDRIAVDDAGLQRERLILLGELVEDLRETGRIAVRERDRRGADEVLRNARVVGALRGAAQHRVLEHAVLVVAVPLLADPPAELVQALDREPAIVDEIKAGRAAELLPKLRDLGLLLCT